jgi:hypothetical protein
MQKVEPIVDERKKLNVQIQAHLPQVRGRHSGSGCVWRGGRGGGVVRHGRH